MSANTDIAAPTGRKKLAQGKERSDAALGHESQNTSSPEGEGGELPMGWRRVAIKEMADSIQYGHTASAVARKDGPRFLRITDIQEGRVDWDAVPSCDIPKEEIPKYRLSSGDLVFARTGATTGKSFLIGDCPEAVFASYLIRVRVSAGVDSRYLSAFFQSPDYWRQIEGGKRGIGQPNVNGQVLGDVQFPVAPLPEQRRIVAEIEKQFTRLEAGVAALRRVQANLKRYRVAVLKAACEGCLVPTEAELHRRHNTKDSKLETGAQLLARILTERRKHWTGRGQYKDPAAPVTANFPPLPKGWAWATVEQLAASEPNSITDGPFGSNLKTEHYMASGPRVIRLQNIGDGVYIDEEAHITQAHFERLQANVLFFDRKPAQEKPWTQKLWIYDLRTNLHFTLKENTLKRSDLDDFVACYFGAPSSGQARAGSETGAPAGKGKSTPHPGPLPGRGGEGGASRHNRKETERFKSFTYDELIKRDKVNLDIFWLKDDALEESANLPAPHIIAEDITVDLETALENFGAIAEDVKK